MYLLSFPPPPPSWISVLVRPNLGSNSHGTISEPRLICGISHAIYLGVTGAVYGGKLLAITALGGGAASQPPAGDGCLTFVREHGVPSMRCFPATIAGCALGNASRRPILGLVHARLMRQHRPTRYMMKIGFLFFPGSPPSLSTLHPPA